MVYKHVSYMSSEFIEFTLNIKSYIYIYHYTLSMYYNLLMLVYLVPLSKVKGNFSI